ncbi:MAG: PKD domain-containing protein [Chitinophagaceae bacterium]|nr:PKD domain-containing protein [Chitinophagaceae bacterium]
MACTNTPVQFNDSSFTQGSNRIVSWQWNYGDGHTESLTAPPFAHTYSNRGNFPVSLKVTDEKGCSNEYVLDVPLSIKKLSAAFSASDTIKCTNSNLHFTCPYAEQGISYHWDFGDGSVAASQSPAHFYTAEGTYTVKLKLTHVAGCEDSSIHSNYIKTEDPVARFSMSDSFRTCPPLIIQFNNQSVNVMEELWDFGDGSTTATHNPSHFYSYPGTYVVSLTVKGRGGCTSKMQRQIVVKGPKGSLSYTPLNFCSPGQATFTAHTTDAVSYIWDFNDGATIINNDSVVIHQYNNTGSYVPKLLLADDNGCKVPINGTDTIHMVNLVAEFNFPDSKICSAEHVDFVNTSSGSENIVSNYWDFGDGFNANNIAQPSHDYQTPGTYYPLLIVRTANGCVDSFTAATPVIVVSSPNAVLQSTGNGCTPLAASFTATANNSAAPIVKWQWDFGNGNTSTVQNPAAQNYLTAGNYVITLVVTSNEGCEKIISKTIEAYPLPNLQISGNTEICKGAATALTATGATSYSWSPAAGLSCTGCASTLATVAANSIYVATGTNSSGCTAKDSVTINVALPFSMSYNSTAKLCAGKSVSLPVTGAAIYEWSPAAGLDNIHTSTPVCQPGNTITYRVIGTDSKACFKDTGFITVQVNALPLVNAGEDKTIASGSSADLVPTISADVTDLRWSPTSSVFRNSGNAVTVKPFTTTAYTVEVKNAAGCTASDTVNVTVSSATATGDVFIPNTFSPNGDGANEVFYPRAAGSVKINRLKILNREGMVVFEKMNFYTNDATSGWDGTSRGMKLPSDVYVYVVEVMDGNGKPKIIPGNISLVR